MKVYGVGLPRTGTTSLSRALEILGYDVAHYCPITNAETKEELQEEHQAYVSSELLLRLKLLEGKWIVLHRDNWSDAMKSIGEDTKPWRKHIMAMRHVSRMRRHNILHYKITDGWKPLCDFLKKPVPSEEFPKLNSMQK